MQSILPFQTTHEDVNCLGSFSPTISRSLCAASEPQKVFATAVLLANEIKLLCSTRLLLLGSHKPNVCRAYKITETPCFA